jgi:hypothetical protein
MVGELGEWVGCAWVRGCGPVKHKPITIHCTALYVGFGLVSE